MDAKTPARVPSALDRPLPLLANPAARVPSPDEGSNAASKQRRPRKASSSSAAPRSTLFWVHSDPQSIAGGTREETLKRIRSHVMSEHNRKKRLENTQRYSSKAWKNLAFQPVASSAAQSSPDTTPERDDAQCSACVHPTDVARHATVFPVRPTAGNAIPPRTRHHPVKTPTPWTYLGPGAKDPFDTMPVALSDRMMRHLQYFLRDLTRAAYPLQRNSRKLQSHWASLLQTDPAPLHACICCAASNQALMSGDLPLVDPTKRWSSPLVFDSFLHRGETIKLVNRGLSDPAKASSDALIAAVSILITIEIASGNPEDLKIHLAGLRQMVALRENFADVAPDVRFQISWTDIRVSCMTLTKPIFPFIRYARPSHLPVLVPDSNAPITASRLLSLTRIPGVLGDTMVEIIYDLLELTLYAEWVRSGSLYSQELLSEETEDYFNTEVLHVEYSLHKDRYTETGELKGDDTIEGCVRLACLLFHNTTIWGFYPQMAAVFPKPIVALRNALESTILAGSYVLCRDLLIWLLFIGACSTPKYFAERSYFVTELASAVSLHGLQSWQELRALLLGFFYVDRSYMIPCQELWDEIQTVLLQR